MSNWILNECNREHAQTQSPCENEFFLQVAVDAWYSVCAFGNCTHSLNTFSPVHNECNSLYILILSSYEAKITSTVQLILSVLTQLQRFVKKKHCVTFAVFDFNWFIFDT